MKIFENIKDNIKESSLSRIVNYIQKYDSGTITAFRDMYSRKENRQRNKSLLSKLLSKGYGVTSVQGVYIENYGKPNAVEVGESVFFVADLKNKGNLKKNLIELGEEFNQDSIMYIYKGGKKGSELIGTNQTGYPGYSHIKKFPIFKTGKDNNEFLTKISGRPFYFKENILSETFCGNISSMYLANLDSKKNWKDLEA